MCCKNVIAVSLGYANVRNTFENYLYEQIAFISEVEDNCTWNETTEIVEAFPLYDFNEEINGYIFLLKNGNEDAGYMHVCGIGDELTFNSFAYQGNGYLFGLLETYDYTYTDFDKLITFEKYIYMG